MKKFLKIALPLFFLLFLFRPAQAHGDKILYFFYGNGCPHCAKEEKFLDSVISKKYPDLQIKRFEVWSNMDNSKILSEAAKKLGISASGVPVTIISDKAFVGYQGDSTTGAKIENAIKEYLADDQCQDYIAPILASGEKSSTTCQAATSSAGVSSERIKIPFFGEINVKSLSLPVLTVVIGSLDGFNPCAMWVLIFLISLLLGMENRKKMWVLGSAFILTSGVIYFLFLSAWLNLFLFLGFVFWIRIIIAVVALWSGYYHLKEYFANKNGACEVVDAGNKKKVIAKMKEVLAKEKFWLALGGIIILAAGVNMVELVCSAGLPAIYTQVLSISNLPNWQYYSYLALYVALYMLDDMVIFVIAMMTLKLKGVTSKYTRWSNLVGGILMLIVGLLLIFKPGWLMFG